MQLRDRELLARLMTTQHVSCRQLSVAAGWKSHTYLQRLLRGDVNTLKPTPALRIAHHLGVPQDILFETKVSTNSGQSSQSTGRKKAS